MKNDHICRPSDHRTAGAKRGLANRTNATRHTRIDRLMFQIFHSVASSGQENRPASLRELRPLLIYMTCIGLIRATRRSIASAKGVETMFTLLCNHGELNIDGGTPDAALESPYGSFKHTLLFSLLHISGT